MRLDIFLRGVGGFLEVALNGVNGTGTCGGARRWRCTDWWVGRGDWVVFWDRPETGRDFDETNMFYGWIHKKFAIFLRWQCLDDDPTYTYQQSNQNTTYDKTLTKVDGTTILSVSCVPVTYRTGVMRFQPQVNAVTMEMVMAPVQTYPAFVGEHVIVQTYRTFVFTVNGYYDTLGVDLLFHFLPSWSSFSRAFTSLYNFYSSNQSNRYIKTCGKRQTKKK